jgi:hypothetical protein
MTRRLSRFGGASAVRWAAATLLCALVGAAPTSAQVVCQGCDRSMTLSQKEWTCLKQKANSGELGKVSTPVIFLSLSRQACESNTRSIYTEPPASNPSAPRVYTLSKSQVRCIMELARDPQLANVPGLSIDFAQACPQQ